jgi:DNA mismatch repair protein MSH5
VVYFPQLGYLCAVPVPEDDDVQQLQAIAPTGWQFQFSTEISVYFKNQEMHDLDTHIGDLYGYILDREVELTQEMLDKVVSVQDVLNDCAEILAEIDVLLALADATRQRKWTIAGEGEGEADVGMQINGSDRT